jgi:beta-galactosidase
MTSTELLKALLERELRAAGIWDWAHDLSGRVSVRRGVNQAGQDVTYLLNYASTPVTVSSPVSGTSLLGDESVAAGDPVTIGKWDLAVIVG